MYSRTIYISLLFFLLPLDVIATTYEDATNKKRDGWHVLKQFSQGTIKNIYDRKKRSRVIKLDGNATRTVYILAPKKKSFRRKKMEQILEWEMNYNEDFVIMIGINTLKGKRFLIYTSGENNSYLQYGLGADSSSGKWKKYRRDLQKDLAYWDNYNSFLNVTSFVVKGSGMVDNIKIVKPKNEKEHLLKPIVQKSSKEKIDKVSTALPDKREKIAKIEREKSKNSTPPTIHLEGKSPMVLKNGESYVEPGAVAKNRDGSTVTVTISDDIDIFKDGEYSVIYMATNYAGHSVIDRRRVIVGKVIQEKKSKEDKLNKSEESEELDENVIDLEQRALEMLEWEKELAFREKELLEQRNRKEVKSPNMSYPSRPGL